MARLNTIGFELGSLAAEVDSTSGSPTLSTTTVRSGAYAARISSLVSATPQRIRTRFLPTATLGPVYGRVYVRFVTFPSAGNLFLSFTETSGTTVAVSVRIDNAGTLTLFDEAGQIPGTHTLSTGQWYRLELAYDGSGAAGLHTVRLYVDGTAAIGATNRSVTRSIASVDFGGNLGSEANAAGEWFFDDLAFNDGTGTAQTGLPGAGSVVHLFVNGDGDTSNRGIQATDWDTGPSTGGTASQMVDDKPSPNDATDYLELIVNSTGSANRVHYFALEDAATPGIGATDAVSLVSVGARVAGETANTIEWVLGLQSQSGGTKLESAAIGAVTSAFVTHSGTAGHKRYQLTSYTDPQAGGAWTPALLDAAQIGVRAPDATPDVFMTQLWALVEYVPAAPPPPPPSGFNALLVSP